jgi:phosphate acetyltransferase
MTFMERMRARARGQARRIVYAEGAEERAIQAAALLRDQSLARPVLLGDAAAVAGRAAALGIVLGGIEVRDPARDGSRARFEERYFELRRHKGLTRQAAADRAAQPHYFGALMVEAGEADGMVSGLNGETKPFLPAFEVVKLREGYRRASSVFVMVWPQRVLFYADCSVNIAPDAATLSEIARASAATARALGETPRVAFLSFSTRGSAEHESVDRMREAARLCREAEPDLPCDGEMQFDAAFVPDVARRKAPDSPLAGGANVFVFPDINAGNIAYKITERLAGAAAVGPVLQGLRKPVNDVSRGCSAQDLADVAVITALQAGG